MTNFWLFATLAFPSSLSEKDEVLFLNAFAIKDVFEVVADQALYGATNMEIMLAALRRVDDINALSEFLFCVVDPDQIMC